MNWFFEHIECVNLARRTDKWAECEREFAKHDLQVERFNAVDGNSIGYVGRLPDGAIGNLLSHIEIIRKAKNNGRKNVLILEDDIEFDDDINDKFRERAVTVPDNWDLLYLGGNHNNQPMVKVAPFVRHITDTYATHAYSIRNTVYDLVLSELGKIDTEGDVIMSRIQKQCNAYCFTPNLAWQRAGISDVFNTYVDYDFLRTKDGNTHG